MPHSLQVVVLEPSALSTLSFGVGTVIPSRKRRLRRTSQPKIQSCQSTGKYTADGFVERFRWGFMPNSTVACIRSMTPARVGDRPVEVHAIDEYVHTDLGYLSLLKPPPVVQHSFCKSPLCA